MASAEDTMDNSTNGTELIGVKGPFTFDGNPVVAHFYSTSPRQLDVLLSSAVEAVSNSRADLVYRFYPPELEALAAAFGEKITTYVAKMKINVPAILDILSKTLDEQEFMTIVGENVYIFIKYTILTTKQYFTTTNKLFAPIDGGGQLMQFKMIHDATSEAKFVGKTTRFLFHGSGFENWYNIFRTGLKCTSGDNANLMVNANVYGAGIYLSDSPTFSLAYCQSRSGSNTKFILAICEVVSDAAISKSTNIFLATDESAILLRYIVYLDKDMRTNQKFTKQMEKLIERLHTSNTKNAARHRRLMGELSRMPLRPGIAITPVCNGGRFTTSWSIKFTDFSVGNTILVHQLREYGIESVDVEIIFGTNFPYSPPFIRLVSPRMAYLPERVVINPELGFLDRGGGICTAMFKTGEWTPGCAMINLIMDIQCMLFMTDGLEIDAIHWATPYTAREALISYNSVIGTFDIDNAIDLLDSR